ncbi:MAG: MMPL family transporter, partial [Myxococcales bacterium]|nr:MMPL family transporter [Myxococcales bacterium]
AVDDTIHYLWRFKREFEATGDYEEAIDRTVHSVGRAIVSTSLLLMGGFGISLFSTFQPPVWFGVLSVITIAVALVADLVVTPAVLVALKPLGPGRGARDADPTKEDFPGAPAVG